MQALLLVLLTIPTGRLVDLTHSFGADTIYWPTENGFQLEKEHEGETPGGWYYAINRFCAAEHGGTHMDAPVHFARGKHTVETVPLTQLIGPAVVVDVSAPVSKDADYEIPVAALEAWQKAHGPIGAGTIVLLRTGFGARWPDRARYLGTDARGRAALRQLHFPGLHPDAARWLLERRVKAVGIDTASIDRGLTRTYESHRVLLGADVPVFENVAKLDALPATGATVIALPMKIEGGSGAPLRIIAILP
jgi:kynurenine formamidase